MQGATSLPAAVGLPACLADSATYDSAELSSTSPPRFWKIKRGLDAVAALIVLVVLSPVLLLLAFFVATSVGWQRRPGLSGKSFHL